MENGEGSGGGHRGGRSCGRGPWRRRTARRRSAPLTPAAPRLLPSRRGTQGRASAGRLASRRQAQLAGWPAVASGTKTCPLYLPAVEVIFFDSIVVCT